MSCEFVFYPAIKEGGVYRPFCLKEDGSPLDIMWRNARGKADMFEGRRLCDLLLDPVFSEHFVNPDFELYLYELDREFIEENADNWDNPEVFPVEVYAEMPEEERKKYGRFSYVDTSSLGYICSVLEEFAETQVVPKGELVFLAFYNY